MRERCYECFRPVPLCFCQQIPRIENRTDVLMLQHVGERHHPFNTARMVRKALRQCELITEHNQRFGRHPLPIRANAGLLYPRVNAPLLTELPAGERPEQLVIIDGTWHQAKTILRDVAQLRDLPCYRLSPASPGRYRIRREPDAQSLSTLEATVAALRVLEPDTVGLDQLLSVFQRMVESQLEYPARQAAWRRKRTRRSRSRYLPDLPWNTEDLVVAYGEATPGRPGPRAATSSPVNWIAQRLGTGDRISCLLRQQSPLSRATLAHLRLTAEDFDVAVSQAEFRHLWSRFIRRGDILIVYHQRTFDLLGHIAAAQPRCVVLKSIFRKWRTFHSQEELMAAEGLTPPTSEHESRAHQRLEMALALVEHLRTQSHRSRNNFPDYCCSNSCHSEGASSD